MPSFNRLCDRDSRALRLFTKSFPQVARVYALMPHNSVAPFTKYRACGEKAWIRLEACIRIDYKSFPRVLLSFASSPLPLAHFWRCVRSRISRFFYSGGHTLT